MNAMRTIGAALASLVVMGAARGQGRIELVSPDGTRTAFLVWSLDDDEVVLHGSDGEKVVFGDPRGSFRFADLPGGLPDWVADAEELAVEIDGVAAKIEGGELLASRFAVGDSPRWALVNTDTNAVFPKAPLSLWMPTDETTGSTGDDAALVREEEPRDFAELTPTERLFSSLRIVANPGSLHAAMDQPADNGGLAALENPNTINTPLAALFESGPSLRFLRDVDWRFQTFEQDGETGLGLAYKYAKSKPLSIKDLANDRGVEGHALDIRAEGNLAFDSDINPSDFTSLSLDFEYFRSTGGAIPALSSAEKKRANDLVHAAATYDSWAKVARSPEWGELKGLARRVLSTQVYWEVGLNAALESDQDLTERNLALGAHAALDIKAWNDRSNAALLNVVDYPAALLRLLTGYDETLQPRGNAIPTILVGLDTVSPDGDTPRKEAGDSSNYERVRLELAYKAPIGIMEGKEYALTALYRKYIEIDASDDVKDAGFDEYEYFTLGIETDDGLFATYSNGQLPFDDDDVEFYEIGWKFGF